MVSVVYVVYVREHPIAQPAVVLVSNVSEDGTTAERRLASTIGFKHLVACLTTILKTLSGLDPAP